MRVQVGQSNNGWKPTAWSSMAFRIAFLRLAKAKKRDLSGSLINDFTTGYSHTLRRRNNDKLILVHYEQHAPDKQTNMSFCVLSHHNKAQPDATFKPVSEDSYFATVVAKI
ncbi:hypothetical protein ElyMa_004218400 [Elysia marginata]|uniref:Uncharacterized protein n=1 Tax=Elysia marginata TaxID=1093978 RepID=A0AAV4GN70_9GAST|nr:hypothetical protein ElyMa_004218400 [Elysia marginata]